MLTPLCFQQLSWLPCSTAPRALPLQHTLAPTSASLHGTIAAYASLNKLMPLPTGLCCWLQKAGWEVFVMFALITPFSGLVACLIQPRDIVCIVAFYVSWACHRIICSCFATVTAHCECMGRRGWKDLTLWTKYRRLWIYICYQSDPPMAVLLWVVVL